MRPDRSFTIGVSPGAGDSFAWVWLLAFTPIQATPLFFRWSVDDDAGWLQAQPLGETVLVSVDASALISGAYQAAVTVTADVEVLGSPVQVPVTLLVSEHVYPVHLAHKKSPLNLDLRGLSYRW